MGRIENDRLEVEIAEIGDYRGSRFDWTGFITQVRLKDGGHTFCVPESRIAGQGTGGSGLSNEFGLFKAIGYEDAAVGEGFPKLGIGILTRTDEEDYNFFKAYPIEPFEVDIKQDVDRIRYRVLPKDCRGYAAELEKTISLQDQVLTIDYRLTNTGAKPIETHEYIHNFIGIDDYPIGPDYTLRLPKDALGLEPASEYTNSLLRVNGSQISWNDDSVREFYFKLPNMTDAGYPWYWEVKHVPSGVGVRESGSFAPLLMAVWGKGHVVSPEAFIDIRVKPGDSLDWTRKYEFFK